MTERINIEAVIVGAAETAGLTLEQSRTGLVSALGLLDRHAEPEALAAFYSTVTGAEAMARSDEARAPRAGLMAGLMTSAGGLSGKAIGEAMSVLGKLEKIGVGREELKRLLPAARDQIRAATGQDSLGEAVKTVPGVGSLLGGA